MRDGWETWNGEKGENTLSCGVWVCVVVVRPTRIVSVGPLSHAQCPQLIPAIQRCTHGLLQSDISFAATLAVAWRRLRARTLRPHLLPLVEPSSPSKASGIRILSPRFSSCSLARHHVDRLIHSTRRHCPAHRLTSCSDTFWPSSPGHITAKDQNIAFYKGTELRNYNKRPSLRSLSSARKARGPTLKCDVRSPLERASSVPAIGTGSGQNRISSFSWHTASSLVTDPSRRNTRTVSCESERRACVVDLRRAW